MGMERRKPEAAGLRRLFQQQWEQVSDRLDRYAANRQHLRDLEAAELAAVETLVEGTNTRLRLVNRYRSRLRHSVRGLLDHVSGLVARLSAPLDISGERFLADPRVNAFFVNRQAMRDVFSRSHDLQDFFSDPLNASCTHAWAVLFMARDERVVLGTALVDGVLTREVEQTTVSFTSHTVNQSCRDEAGLRSALESFLYESLVEYVDYRLTCMRFGAKGGCIPCQLVTEEGMPDLANPAVYLERLCQVLDHAEQLLHLEEGKVRLNRIGIKVAEGASEVAHDIPLQAIGVGRHAHQTVALVVYPRAEMRTRDDLLRQAELGLGPGGRGH